MNLDDYKMEFRSEASNALNNSIIEFIKNFNIKVEELTQEQTAQALKQAIAAGDFQVMIVKSDDGFSRTQAVTYIPFRDVERLKAKIAELEARIELIQPTLK